MHVRQGMDAARRSGDVLLEAEMFVADALLQREMGAYPRAVISFRQAQRIFRWKASLTFYADSLHGEALTWLRAGNVEESARVGRDCVRVSSISKLDRIYQMGVTHMADVSMFTGYVCNYY